MDKIIHLLFWPWFHYQQFFYSHAKPMPISQRLCLLFFIVVLLLIIRLKVDKRIKTSGWPKFLEIGAQIVQTTILFIFLGGLANLFVMAANQSKMPVAVSECEVMELDDLHAVATNETNFLFLADYINAGRSVFLRFLYPRHDCLSPGDLGIPAGIILSWWTALTITFLGIVYALRILFKKI